MQTVIDLYQSYYDIALGIKPCNPLPQYLFNLQVNPFTFYHTHWVKTTCQRNWNKFQQIRFGQTHSNIATDRIDQSRPHCLHWANSSIISKSICIMFRFQRHQRQHFGFWLWHGSVNGCQKDFFKFIPHRKAGVWKLRKLWQLWQCRDKT